MRLKVDIIQTMYLLKGYYFFVILSLNSKYKCTQSTVIGVFARKRMRVRARL